MSELWGEPPPAEASKTLQVTVSRLRKALEPERSAGQASQLLVTRPPGYELRVEPEELDLGEVPAGGFRWTRGRSRRAIRHRRPIEYGRRWRVWRGPPLADLVYEAPFQEEIGRLEELRLAAHEDRLGAATSSSAATRS